MLVGELVRCPKCGAEPVFITRDTYAIVGCSECVFLGPLRSTTAEAIYAWNLAYGKQCFRCGGYYEELWADLCDTCAHDMGVVP